MSAATGGVRGIDHLVMVVPDLPHAVSDLGEVGFHVVSGGQHSDGRTENALIRFESGSYLEVVGFRGRDAARGHRWERALAPGGFADYALSVDSVKASRRVGERLGLAIEGPLEGGRVRPDGIRIAWRTLRLASGSSSWLPFLIEDVTPRDERLPAGSGHDEDGGPRLIGVTIGVHDLDRAADVFGQLVDGLAVPIASGVHFQVGLHQVALTTVPSEAREGVIEAMISASGPLGASDQLPLEKTHGARILVARR